MASREVVFPATKHARNYSQTAWEYAQAAISDRRGKSYCKWVKKAARRFVSDLRRRGFKYHYDCEHANNACDFIEKLPHVQGSWDSKNIELQPWQCFLLCNIFGWRTKDDRRRFTFVYLELARKGAKSTLSAAVALYCLTCEDEVGPQIVIGATTGQQADKVFLPAKQMVEQTPALRKWKGLEPFARSVTCSANMGSIQPINSKSSTQDGWNPHVGMLDELHAHPNRGLFDVIRSAFGARRNPLMWLITTAGYDTMGVCYEQRTMITKVLDKKIEAEHVFGVIYTLDDKDDPFDESKWIKANPMIGITPTWDSMRDYAAEAKASPQVAFEFKTKKLNIWTTAKDAWMNMVYWDRLRKSFDEKEVEDLPCYAGIDLGATADLTALVLLWVNEETGVHYVASKFYLPEETIEEHVKRRGVAYKEWVDKGWITPTPGNTTDYDFIQKDLLDVAQRFHVKQVGYDPWKAQQLVLNLQNEGVPMIEVRQGAKTMHQPMQDLERDVRRRLVVHDGNPVLTWNMSNVIMRPDPNLNMAPDKKNSHEKIDGAVALIEAYHVSTLEPEPQFEVAAAIA